MIYDVNGRQINNAYDTGGVGVLNAYDINGGMVFPDSFQLKIMTYNVQGWGGINSQQTMQNTIISSHDTDIIGFQEFCSNGVVPTIAQNVLSSYPNLRLSNHVNYNAVASKHQITNWQIVDYTTQDPHDISAWGETRCYMKGNLHIYGKDITIINTHLCPTNAEPKYAQMAELLALASQEECCIITGDFNSFLYDSPSGEEYANMYAPFANAGFKMANHSPTNFTKTWTNNTSATSLTDFTYPTDDIMVSSNIDIVNVEFDTTKLNYLNGSQIDHVPIIVTLEIS